VLQTSLNDFHISYELTVFMTANREAIGENLSGLLGALQGSIRLPLTLEIPRPVITPVSQRQMQATGAEGAVTGWRRLS